MKDDQPTPFTIRFITDGVVLVENRNTYTLADATLLAQQALKRQFARGYQIVDPTGTIVARTRHAFAG